MSIVVYKKEHKGIYLQNNVCSSVLNAADKTISIVYVAVFAFVDEPPLWKPLYVIFLVYFNNITKPTVSGG